MGQEEAVSMSIDVRILALLRKQKQFNIGYMAGIKDMAWLVDQDMGTDLVAKIEKIETIV